MTTLGATRTLLAAGGAAAALTATHAVPAVTTWGPLRRRLTPGLAGLGRPDHVALTFDDGPDPRSTPAFLTLLDKRGVHATFFLLGAMLARSPGLAREIAAAGHEIGVHGWEHRPLLLRGPRATRDDLARARDAVAEATGTPPRLFRPPYGAMTTAAHLHARRLGLTPVLWTCWGEDWTSRATAATVRRTVLADLRGGGTILLHDSDCTSATGAWHSALGALPGVLDACAARGLRVGPLRDHGTARPRPARPRPARPRPDRPRSAGMRSAAPPSMVET